MNENNSLTETVIEEKPPIDKLPQKKKHHSTEPILSPDNRTLALRMFAEGNTAPEIIRYFKANNIKSPTQPALYMMFKAKCYQAEIASFREDYYSRIKEVPISHKRTRLEIKQELVESLKKLFRKMLDKDGNIRKKQFKAFLSLTKRLDEVLISAQDEMERRPGTVVTLMQNFGDKELSMEEILVEERNITSRIAELQREGVSISDRTAQYNKTDKEGKNTK